MTLAAAASLGLTGCAGPASDAARCAQDVPLAEAAREALLEHAAQVPAPVGEASTRLIIATFAGCDPGVL